MQIANEQQLDLIFMDIKMDIMNGVEATTLLRSNPKTASIPIIALSGTEPDEKTLAIFDDFLQKPFSLKIIRQKTQQFLQFSGTEDQTTDSLPTNKEKSPLTTAEKDKLLNMITTANNTGNLVDHQALAHALQQYGKTYNNETLTTVGLKLAADTKRGAIIQIETHGLQYEN